MAEFTGSATTDPPGAGRVYSASLQFDGRIRSSSTRRQSRSSAARSPYYQRYQQPPPPSPTTVSQRSAIADAYAASVASRVIQPPIVDFRESKGWGGGAKSGIFPDRYGRNAAAAVVASIERCSEPVQNGHTLHTDIREIRRIIKAYVGRLQDREMTNQVAKEWRIVARVLDRLFFMLYIGTIVVSLATMFPKGENRVHNDTL